MLSPDDVFLTVGCIQAIEVTLMVLACPGANILLPRPCFPSYDAHASSNNLEVRYFDLIPEKGWEVDIEGVEALADENTVAMVVIYEARVRFETRVRVRVRVRDSAIFEKSGCGCGRTRRLKNY